MTVVVADTGEINAMKAYQPEDATTNPSLLYKVAQNPEYTDYIVVFADVLAKLTSARLGVKWPRVCV